MRFPVSIRSDSDLHSFLDGPRLYVPSRADGRQKEDREDYCLTAFVAIATRLGALDLPIEIGRGRAGEAPDFLFGEKDTPNRLGLEHTDLPDPDYQKRLSMEDPSNPPVQLDNEHAWVGDEPEQRFSDLVVEAIITKRNKAAERAVLGCVSQDLIIYKLFHGGLGMEWNTAIPIVQNKAREEIQKYTELTGGGRIHLMDDHKFAFNIGDAVCWQLCDWQPRGLA